MSGYFCIITSEKMTAKEAIKLYKSRDASEKLFRGDKSYLGDKSLRIYGDSSADAKIFIEFIALIIRNRIYNYLQDEMKALAKRPNFMTVPAAIRELEKIEMVRLQPVQARPRSDSDTENDTEGIRNGCRNCKELCSWAHWGQTPLQRC